LVLQYTTGANSELAEEPNYGKSHGLLQYALKDRLNRQFQVKLLKLDYLAI
jgi:hypothetical protein